MTRTQLRRGSIAASILIYAALAHYSNANHTPVLGTVLAVGPPLIGVLLLARRAPWAWLVLPATALVSAGLLWRYWGLLEHNFPLMYLWQQCAAYVTLAAVFARSLMPGQVPLCTEWADMLHGPLPSDARRYTRSVTAAWVVFFLAVAAASAALYAFAPLTLWSVFSNFLTLPLVVLMFLGEYTVRRWLLPSMNRFTLGDTARAYLAALRAGEAPRI